MPTNAKNKIKFGLSKAFYAVKGTEGYGTPKAASGAVSLSLAPQGELYKFFADNLAYYRAESNNGYEGDLELALVGDDFLVDVLGNSLDSTDKVLIEQIQNAPTEFAFGFQIEGDVKNTRFWLYNCVATRPSIDGETKEERIEAKTEKITISSSPTEDGIVRVKTTVDTPQATYDAWFNEVWEPTTPAST